MIFDSKYDQFKGVVAYVRVVNGSLSAGEKVRLMGTGVEPEVLEAGYFSPVLVKSKSLGVGEVGYVAYS